ncbi:MAG: SDR family oxidoreductase [Actinomycetota bacterium]|nr:SDR family oxidoreductase [Actinomycetota bacterium]
MKIAVVGATGRTGSQVVEQGLARGHYVTALARNPDPASARHPNLVTVRADVLDRESIGRALHGAEAVVSALGIGTSRTSTVVYSEGIANILTAMRASSIRRVAAISAAPVGPRAEQPFIERRLAMPILDRIFGATYADMRRMEKRLADSDVDWISLRPPRLVEKPGTGGYRLGLAPLPKARSLTYTDLAAALLDSLDREDLYHRAAFVAN